MRAVLFLSLVILLVPSVRGASFAPEGGASAPLTPAIAQSWSARVDQFFIARSPNLADLSDVWSSVAQLDLFDARVQAALEPVAAAIRSGADRALARPADGELRENVERLAALRIFRGQLDSEQRTAIDQAWTARSAELSETERAQIERRLDQIARQSSPTQFIFGDHETVDASQILYEKKNQSQRQGDTLMPASKEKNLQMPPAEPNGFVKTLNNMGYMTSSLDPYSQEFVNFAKSAPGPVLDIGAAYGVASLAALNNGARVIANDIEPKHLDILQKRADANVRGNLTLEPGAFPEGVNFAAQSIGAVLIARVLHFFDGPKIEQAAAALFRWLAPGGKVFIVAETPYLKNFQRFIPTYEARKKLGEPWPGWVDDVMAFSPERGKSLPPKMHFLDPEVLSRVFKAAGFRIEKVGTFARTDFPKDIQFDGRESVGMIAVKD